MLSKLIDNDTDEVRIKWVEDSPGRIATACNIIATGAIEPILKIDFDLLHYIEQDLSDYEGTGVEGTVRDHCDNLKRKTIGFRVPLSMKSLAPAKNICLSLHTGNSK